MAKSSRALQTRQRGEYLFLRERQAEVRLMFNPILGMAKIRAGITIRKLNSTMRIEVLSKPKIMVGKVLMGVVIAQTALPEAS